MLNYEGTKKGAKPMPIDQWTEEEFDLIAAELKRLYPKKGYGNFYGLEFTENQVEEAAETVLPQHRHKSIADYHDIRRPMFDAFTRIAQPLGKRTIPKIVEGSFDSDGRIKWSPQEWEAVILELHRICPQAFEERLKNVHIGSVRLAMEVLTIPRRRQFKQIVSFKEQALRTWDDLPTEVKDPSKAERVIVDFPSGPVMAPPVTSKMKESPMAAALQKAFTEPTKEVKTLKVPIITEKPRKKRVSWTAEDWLLIAREMYRQDPFGNLLTTTFSRIDLAAIKAAQRKIFSWENHKALKNSEGLREPLIAAFATLKEEIANKGIGPATQIQVKQEPLSEPGTIISNIATLPPGQKRTAAARASQKLISPETRTLAAMKGHKTRAAKKQPKETTERKTLTARQNIAIARAKFDDMTPEERAAVAVKGWETRRAKQSPKTVEVKEVGPVGTELAQSAPIRPTSAPVQEMAPSPAPVRYETDFLSKVLNAAAPLMNLLIDEAVSRLAPSLTAAVVGQVEKSLGGVVERVLAEKFPKIEVRDMPILSHSAAIAQQQYEALEASLTTTESAPSASGPLSKTELAKFLPKPTEKPKKPKIAMLMSLGPQREQIRYSFPEYEFVFIDHGHGIKDAAKSCVLFVAVEKFINSNNKQQIKAYVDPEILKYVDGGVSAIKRQINVWKAAQKA